MAFVYSDVFRPSRVLGEARGHDPPVPTGKRHIVSHRAVESIRSDRIQGKACISLLLLEEGLIYSRRAGKDKVRPGPRSKCWVHDGRAATMDPDELG